MGFLFQVHKRMLLKRVFGLCELSWLCRYHRHTLLQTCVNLHTLGVANTIIRSKKGFSSDEYVSNDLNSLPNTSNPHLSTNLPTYNLYDTVHPEIYQFQYYFLSEIISTWSHYTKTQKKGRYDKLLMNKALIFRGTHLLASTFKMWKLKILQNLIRLKNILRLYFLSWRDVFSCHKDELN